MTQRQLPTTQDYAKFDVKSALSELQRDSHRADLRLHLMMVKKQWDRNRVTSDVYLPPASALARSGLETWLSRRATAPVEPYLLAQAWLIKGHEIACQPSLLPYQSAPLSEATSDIETTIGRQRFTKLECYCRAVDSILAYGELEVVNSSADDPVRAIASDAWFSLAVVLEQNQFVQLINGRSCSNVDCLLQLIKLDAAPSTTWFALASAIERSTLHHCITCQTTALSLDIYPRAIAHDISVRDDVVLSDTECRSHGLRLLCWELSAQTASVMLPDGLIITTPPAVWLPLLAADATADTTQHDGREVIVACTCTGQGAGGINSIKPLSCRTPFSDFWWTESQFDCTLFP